MSDTPPHAAASLLERLHALGVAFERSDHAPVFTCDEADRAVPADLGGVHTKNLFLRDRKGACHWLLVTTCEKAVDLKTLSARLGVDGLGLASPERLLRHLGLTPGAVTVFGLLNDPDHAVVLLVDRDVWEAPSWRCHPLVNTSTLIVPREGITTFLASTGHQARVVDVPVR